MTEPASSTSSPASSRDARGRILLARRTEGRDLAGLWEFPGGKASRARSPKPRWIRELHEELGIDVELGAALIAVPQAIRDKRLRLDVRRDRALARHRRAAAKARRWPGCRRTSSPAIRCRRPTARWSRRCCSPIATWSRPSPGDDDAAWLRDAGTRAGQRHSPRAAARAAAVLPRAGPRWRASAARLCRAARRRGAVNGDIELARGAGHRRAPARGAAARSLRQRPLPPDVPVAASCHEPTNCALAQDLGCDFAVLGPVDATPAIRARRRWAGTVRGAARRRVAADLRASAGWRRGDHRDRARTRRAGHRRDPRPLAALGRALGAARRPARR